MSVPQEIQTQIHDMLKKEAVKSNKDSTVFTIIFITIFSALLVGAVSLGYVVIKDGYTLYGLIITATATVLMGIFIYGIYDSYRDDKIPLDDAGLMNWYLGLSNEFEIVREIEMLIETHWQGERKIIYLKDYTIHLQNQTRYLSFSLEGEHIRFPLRDVVFDEHGKRIEFYESNQDWSTNLKEGTMFNISVFNV